MESTPYSVIIPTYNRARMVVRAIRSVLPAVLPMDEIIVVDDGSTDGTRDALREFGSRIRYVQGEHKGGGAARNLGIRESRHSMVAFLDSDDEWQPDKLYLQRAVMARQRDLVFCFSDFSARSAGRPDRPHSSIDWHHDHRLWTEILGPATSFSTIAPLPKGRADFQVYTGSLYEVEMQENYVGTSTLVVNRDLAGDALHFVEGVPIYEDWECFGLMARKGPCAYLECDTSAQWGHAGERLSSACAFDVAQSRLRVLKNVWGADAQFMARHGIAVEKIKAEQHAIRARHLLRQGRTREARAELAQVSCPLFAYRTLACMPGVICRGIFGAFKLVSGLSGRNQSILHPPPDDEVGSGNRSAFHGKRQTGCPHRNEVGPDMNSAARPAR